MRLGDILKQVKGLTRIGIDGKIEGKYPFIFPRYDGLKMYRDTYDYEGPCLIIRTTDVPGVYLEEKFNVSSDYNVYCLENEDIKIEYVYYYLHSNLNTFKPLFKRDIIHNKILNENIENIEIPIIPLEKQEHLIATMEEVLNTLNGKKISEDICEKLGIEGIDYPTKIFSERFVDEIMSNILNRYL